MSVGVSSYKSASDGTVTVGIPAYNEAATIKEVVERARIYADEVVVVDDGSEDGTQKRASAAGATVISHHRNRGYGATLRTLFEYAYDNDAAHLVILDGDGQHDANDIPNLVRTQQETGAEVVTGSRFADRNRGDIPAYRRFGLAVVNLLTNLGLRVGYSYPAVSDTQCGFRAYDATAIRDLADGSDIGTGMGASLDILFEAARNGYEIVEVSTRVDYEVDNASSRHPVLHGMTLIKSIFLSVAYDRPGRVATAISLALFVGIAVVYASLQINAIVAVVIPVLIALGVLLTLSLGRPSASKKTDN